MKTTNSFQELLDYIDKYTLCPICNTLLTDNSLDGYDWAFSCYHLTDSTGDSHFSVVSTDYTLMIGDDYIIGGWEKHTSIYKSYGYDRPLVIIPRYVDPTTINFNKIVKLINFV